MEIIFISAHFSVTNSKISGGRVNTHQASKSPNIARWTPGYANFAASYLKHVNLWWSILNRVIPEEFAIR